MRRLCLMCLLVACLLFSAAAPAQPAPATAPSTNVTLGQSVVALNGPWKFHVGDDPRWADPSFDDSKWETVDLTPKAGSFDPISGIAGYVPGWSAKGHPKYWGYAWYRLHVQVVARAGESLSLAGPADVDDIYQAFANGALIGSFGKFRDNGKAPAVYYTQPMMFRLPDVKTDGQGAPEMVLALRVWMQPNTLLNSPDAGGLHMAPSLGETGAVTAKYELAWLASFLSYTTVLVEAALFFLLAAAVCSLILFDRSDPVYWWLAGVFLLVAIERASVCVGSWTQIFDISTWLILIDVLLHPLILGGWVMVWWAWFRLRRPVWMPKAIGILTLLYMLSNALGEDIFYNVIPHPVGAAIHLGSVCIRILFLLPLIFIVVEGVAEQGREGWLALPAVLLVGIAQFQTELGVLHVRTAWFPFGQQITLAQISYLTLAVVIFVLLVRRLLLSIRQQRQLALDVKQAQEVQQVILPESVTSLAGFAIESEYRPAREVGGDFFQIIPRASDGSILIVAGDVAGKGLKAGMLVALLVGAIRGTAELNSDPQFVLQALNRRLTGRGDAHATCLAMRIEADGMATLANAGHLPPYVNGKPVAMEGALPLGVLQEAEFSVMRFKLNEGDRLMMVSDGIAEAMDAEGKLFGFARVEEMLEQAALSATALAEAAQRFGQQDDISVISVSRVMTPKPAMA